MWGVYSMYAVFKGAFQLVYVVYLNNHSKISRSNFDVSLKSFNYFVIADLLLYLAIYLLMNEIIKNVSDEELIMYLTYVKYFLIARAVLAVVWAFSYRGVTYSPVDED